VAKWVLAEELALLQKLQRRQMHLLWLVQVLQETGRK
jgi:hypothetical protein